MADGFQPIPGALGDVQTGVRVAQMEQQVQTQKQELEQKRQKFELQKSDMAFNQLNRILTLPKAAQSVAVKKYKRDMGTLGVTIDDEAIALATDPEYSDRAKEALAMVSGLPDSERSKAGIGFLSMLTGDTESLVKQLNSIGTVQQRKQEAQGKILAQQTKEQRDVLTKAQEFLEKDPIAVKNREVINQANALFRLAEDPRQRRNAFNADAARTIFAKVLDPKTGVREGEVLRIRGLNVGVTQSLADTINRFINGRELNDNQWAQITNVVSQIAQDAQDNTSTLAERRKLQLESVGLSPQDAARSLVELRQFDPVAAGLPPVTGNQMAAIQLSPQQQSLLEQISRERGPKVAEQVRKSLFKKQFAQQKRQQKVQGRGR